MSTEQPEFKFASQRKAARRAAEAKATQELADKQARLTQHIKTAKSRRDLNTLVRRYLAGLDPGWEENPNGAAVNAWLKANPELALKFRDLLIRVTKVAPDLVNTHCKQILYLITRPWAREPAGWQPRGASAESILRSLIDHLLGRYRVPKYLYEPFLEPIPLGNLNPTPDEAMVRLFEAAAQGGSVYKLVQSGVIKVPLTKRMCHLMLNMNGAPNTIHAIRWAQVRALEGERRLAEALCQTRLGDALHGDSEEFWLTFIHWLCNNPMLDLRQIPHLYDYIITRRRGEPNFSMKGRTPLALLRDMEVWHGQLAKIKEKGETAYKPSVFNPGIYEQVLRDFGNGARDVVLWTVEEILTSRQLREEGAEMRHCVYSYGHYISTGATSVWSLRADKDRRLTIEVSNAQRSIVQARGLLNARPRDQEMRYLRQWAGENGLQIKTSAW